MNFKPQNESMLKNKLIKCESNMAIKYIKTNSSTLVFKLQKVSWYASKLILYVPESGPDRLR